jgi:polyferredoxin
MGLSKSLVSNFWWGVSFGGVRDQSAKPKAKFGLHAARAHSTDPYGYARFKWLYLSFLRASILYKTAGMFAHCGLSRHKSNGKFSDALSVGLFFSTPARYLVVPLRLCIYFCPASSSYSRIAG